MRKDLYDTVTASIIRDLENGIAPWVRPWSESSPGSSCMPRNASTKRAYSGVNVLVLWGAASANGYSSNDWLTYKQAQAIGAQVRGGERGTTIYYADKFIPRENKSDPDARARYFLKCFSVFNADQIDGLTREPVTVHPIPEQVASAEALIAATGAVIRHGGDAAYYHLQGDSIQMPVHAQFIEHINYYRTAFHELGHWTGAKHRLCREYGKRFGDMAYAREELVAEMCAAFVCASQGISPTVRHSDYLASWLQVLKEDSRAIFQAASAASKAAEYIQAFAGTKEEAESIAA